jgi:hypothetical protein
MTQQIMKREAALATPRPKLTEDGVVAYIDWALGNIGRLGGAELDAHLRGAELVLRGIGFAAQNKATQHTLVEDGTIKPPPAPLGG